MNRSYGENVLYELRITTRYPEYIAELTHEVF